MHWSRCQHTCAWPHARWRQIRYCAYMTWAYSDQSRSASVLAQRPWQIMPIHQAKQLRQMTASHALPKQGRLLKGMQLEPWSLERIIHEGCVHPKWMQGLHWDFQDSRALPLSKASKADPACTAWLLHMLELWSIFLQGPKPKPLDPDVP